MDEVAAQALTNPVLAAMMKSFGCKSSRTTH
jgi:hypothetical protein